MSAMKLFLALLAALIVSGCETKSLAEDAHTLEVGMTLKQVNSILGDDPWKVEQKGEIKRYVWLYTSKGIQRAVYVDFKDGKVWELPDTQSQLNGYRRE